MVGLSSTIIGHTHKDVSKIFAKGPIDLFKKSQTQKFGEPLGPVDQD
jgi:hypothetical protein